MSSIWKTTYIFSNSDITDMKLTFQAVFITIRQLSTKYFANIKQVTQLYLGVYYLEILNETLERVNDLFFGIMEQISE